MKLTLLLTCLTALQISASVYSQNTTISLKSAQGNFGEIINAIEEQTEFKVFYKNEQIDLSRKIQFSASSASVADLLTKALEGTDMVYTLLDKIIVLSPKEIAQAKQQITIKGKVVDENGQVIPGVNIVEKGTTNGGITDIDGNFTISVATTQSILVISFVGYTQQEVLVGTQTNISVTLTPDLMKLDEVVVIGYGVQKKKLVTGATTQVKGDEILKRNSTSVLTALQGQTPGVQITSKSGQAGDGFRINVRGLGTIGDASPLYIVDGVQTSDISYLNASDIESLDVLKDAASSAIYGSRAANGVILVTTKQGKVGKTQVSYDGYYGIQNLAKKLDLCNAQEYAVLQNEAAVNSVSTIIDFAAKGVNLATVGNGTNWIDKASNKDAITQNHSLGITGGSENSVFSASLSYTQQDGIFGGPVQSKYDRYSIRVNSEHKAIKKYAKIGEHLTFSYIKKSGLSQGNIYANRLHGLYTVSPFLQFKDSLGNYVPSTSASWNPEEANPVALMEYSDNNRTVNNKVFGDVYAIINPVKGLNFKTTFGIDYYGTTYRSYTPKYALSTVSVNTIDNVEQNMSNGITWAWENILNYDYQLKNHSINAMIGMSARRFNGEYLKAKKGNLTTNGFDYAYVGNGTTIADNTADVTGKAEDEDNLLSYFGRVNYNYAEKYLLSATFRVDGSSKFGPNNRWGYFPSVSAGWVITNESFTESFKNWLDFFKVRASWGQNGNQNISSFNYLSQIKTDVTYNFGTDDANAQTGGYPSVGDNKDVKWETSEQLDFGFDSRILQGKINLVFDYYKKTTKNWLIQVAQLDIHGADAPFVNGGNVENKGIELGLGWNHSFGAFHYSINGNISYNENKVKSIPNEEGIIHGTSNTLWQGMGEIYRAEVGKPIGYFWGYKTNGIFQNTEEVNSYKQGSTVIQPKAEPGDVRYVDLNSDGVINELDRTKIGNPYPDISYGLSFSCDYKGFDFSIITNGVSGNQIAKGFVDFSRSSTNYTTDFLNRWHGEGTSNKMPRMLQSNSENWLKFSDLYLEDGDFWKISNVTIGYDFNKLLKNSPFGEIRFYASALNLYTFTKYSGMDPEVGYGATETTTTGATATQFSSGIDLGYYPHPRTFLLGLSVKF